MQERQSSFHSLFHRGHQARSSPASVWDLPSSYRKQGFFHVLPESYRVRNDSRISNGPRASQEPHGQHEQRAHEFQNAVNGDSHDAEWKKQQPDKRINHQRQQCERPAQNKEDDPKKKSSHGNLTMDRGNLLFHATTKRTNHSLYYDRARWKVPFTAKSFRRRRLAMDSGTSASSRMCESSTSE